MERGKLGCGINFVVVFKIKKLLGDGSGDAKYEARCACVGVQTWDPEKWTGKCFVPGGLETVVSVKHGLLMLRNCLHSYCEHLLSVYVNLY